MNYLATLNFLLSITLSFLSSGERLTNKSIFLKISLTRSYESNCTYIIGNLKNIRKLKNQIYS